MADWKSDFVYGWRDWASHLVLYGRYIDDILFIWRGGEASLLEFISRLTDNEWGIKLETKYHPQSIEFLDLNIYIEDGLIKTKTFFKQVDSNSFIHQSSCHAPHWLGAVPKGQFQRMRRNCSELSQFRIQAEKLKGDFLEKGYEKERNWSGFLQSGA